MSPEEPFRGGRGLVMQHVMRLSGIVADGFFNLMQQAKRFFHGFGIGPFIQVHGLVKGFQLGDLAVNGARIHVPQSDGGHSKLRVCVCDAHLLI